MLWSGWYGAFTLPDTETDTDADKLAQNPMGICQSVCLCAIWTPPRNSIQAIYVIGFGVGQWTHHYLDGTPSSERHSCLKISPLKEDDLEMQLLSQWDTFFLCVVCRRSWTPSCLTTWSSSNRRRCVGTAQARHGRRSAFCVTLPSPCALWCPAANLSLGMYYWRLKVHLHWAKSERESDIAPDGFIENTIECIH